MTPGQRLSTGRVANASPRGAGKLFLESENASTGSPIKQLPINVLPDLPPSDVSTDMMPYTGPRDYVYDPPMVPTDTTPTDGGEKDFLVTPVDYLTNTQPTYYTATVSGRGQKPTRASGGVPNGDTAPPSPAQVVGNPPPAAVIYPAAPPTAGNVPAPVTVLPNQPPATTVLPPSPGSTTTHGAPAPAQISTGLIPAATAQNSGNYINLFGYQIPLGMAIIGGLLLAFWLMDTHKGGKR